MEPHAARYTADGSSCDDERNRTDKRNDLAAPKAMLRSEREKERKKEAKGELNLHPCTDYNCKARQASPLSRALGKAPQIFQLLSL